MTEVNFSHMSACELNELVSAAQQKAAILNQDAWQKVEEAAKSGHPPVLLFEGKDKWGRIAGVGLPREGAMRYCGFKNGGDYSSYILFSGNEESMLDMPIPAVPVPLAMIQDLLESLDQESHAARCKKWGQELKTWLESQPYFNWPPSQETQQEGNQE